MFTSIKVYIVDRHTILPGLRLGQCRYGDVVVVQTKYTVVVFEHSG